MHRDLKPDNILVGNDGHIKLTDFGLSDKGLKTLLSKVNENLEESKEETVKITKEKKVVGTADYMAPELLSSKVQEVSYMMDFWSFGIVAFEVLTGILPFNAETADRVFKNIMKKEIEFPEVGIEDG